MTQPTEVMAHTACVYFIPLFPGMYSLSPGPDKWIKIACMQLKLNQACCMLLIFIIIFFPEFPINFLLIVYIFLYHYLFLMVAF